MANKLYSVHDKWLDIDKVNDVDIESIDGVITSVKVNGEEAGGGGSSDLSIVNVTVINNTPFNSGITIPTCYDSAESPLGFPIITAFTNTILSGSSAIIKVPLYKGVAGFTTDDNVTTSGNITYNEEYHIYTITGDCTITISLKGVSENVNF